MKVFLMYRDRDFDADRKPTSASLDLMKDLGLGVVIQAMAGGDEFLFSVSKSAILQSLHEHDAILYRQRILDDCMKQPDVVREMYAIAVEAIERERKVWGWKAGRYPEGTLRRGIEVLEIFSELLKKLRQVADAHTVDFDSEGFERLFSMLAKELNDEYLRSVQEHLQSLRFQHGLLLSAQLGRGNQGAHYVLRRMPYVTKRWYRRLQDWMDLQTSGHRRAFVYEVHERDEAGYNALSRLKSLGIAHIAAALAQSTDHILSFFQALRMELGFYLGCLNLRDRLLQKREPLCFPVPLPKGQGTLTAKGLYDISLSLISEDRIIRNDISASGKDLLMITGANRGGKSTFLRSFGLAQWMMQCGMFVPAEFFEADLCSNVLTHFKREEDAEMKSGKLDEELSRMSEIVKELTPHSVVLFNESFASTNEREGSEIARQIVHALLESQIKVVYVTHMFTLAHAFYLEKDSNALFLRAERLAGGGRTFRIVEGEPLPTSYGPDLYRRIFDNQAAPTSEPTASAPAERTE